MQIQFIHDHSIGYVIRTSMYLLMYNLLSTAFSYFCMVPDMFRFLFRLLICSIGILCATHTKVLHCLHVFYLQFFSITCINGYI